MAEIPEELLRRSAEAKARATGRDVDEILAEMKGEKTPAAAAAEEAPATPESVEAGPPDDSLKAKAQTAAAALPPHLLRRSAEARAKALGVPVEQVIAEMTGAAAQATETPAPATEEPSPAAATPPVAAPASPMPEKLLIRSAEAKAKATGRPVDEIIAELRSMTPPTPAPEAPATPAPAPPAPATEAPAPAPEATPPTAPPPGPLPEKLLIRSAEAKAKASGRPVDEIIAELRSMAPPTPAPDPAKEAVAATEAPAPASETAPAPAATAAKVPGKLLRRSAEAKAKATGRPVEEILAELMGDAAAPAPAAAPTTAAPVAAAPDPAKAAAAAAIPEHLLRRSAEARAKATGGSAEQILAEWMGAATAAPAPAADAAPAEAAPVAAAPDPAKAAAAAAIPEHLLRRSAEARAKATGGSAEQILAEWMGAATAAPAPAAAAPAVAAPVAAAPEPVEAPAAFTTEHVPEHLLRRSAEARAKATGRPVDEILAELTDEKAAAAASAPAAAPVPIADTAEAVSPPAPDDTSTLPAVEKEAAIRSAGPEPMGTINVRPHLLAIGFAALLVVMALLAVFWLVRDVHLLEVVNLNNQSAPCKGLIIGFASITVLLGSLFLIHYTKLGRRPVFLVAGSALFGFMAIVGLMYSLHTPRGLNPESVDGLNAFELRILPGTLMLGSLILFAIFVFALSRLDSKQE